MQSATAPNSLFSLKPLANGHGNSQALGKKDDHLLRHLRYPDNLTDAEVAEDVSFLLQAAQQNPKAYENTLLRFIFVFSRRLSLPVLIDLYHQAAESYSLLSIKRVAILTKIYRLEQQLFQSGQKSQLDTLEKVFVTQAFGQALECMTIHSILKGFDNGLKHIQNQLDGAEQPDKITDKCLRFMKEHLDQAKLWAANGRLEGSLTLLEALKNSISLLHPEQKPSFLNEIDSFGKTLKETDQPHSLFLYEQYSKVINEEILSAYKKGNAETFSEKVESCLHPISILASLGQKDISILLLSNLEILFTHQLPSHSGVPYEIRSKCNQSILAVKETLHNPARYACKWSIFRESFHILKDSSTSAKDFSTGFIPLFKEICVHLHQLVGRYAPCGYTPLLFGSHVRFEATHLSDIDIAFLKEEGISETFFASHFLPAFIQPLRFYLTALQDTWVLNTGDNYAICVDSFGGSIDEDDVELLTRTQPVLVKTAKQFLTWMKSGEKELYPYCYGLFFARNVFDTSDLYEQFSNLVKDDWQNYQARRQIFRHFLKMHLTEFPVRREFAARRPFHPYCIDLKRAFLNPLTQVCFDLAFHEGLENFDSNPKILSLLGEKKTLPLYFLQALSQAWQTLHQLRWQKQAEISNEPDGNDPNRFYVKSPPVFEPHDRIRLPFLAVSEIELLEEIDRYIIELAFGALQRLYDTGQVFDPLLAHCHIQLSTLPAFKSKALHVQGIIQQLHQRRIPIKSLQRLRHLNPPADGKQAIPLSESLKEWLMDKYTLCNAEERLVFIFQLLKTDALFYWVRRTDIGNLIEALVHTPTTDGQRVAEDIDMMLFCNSLKKFFEDPRDDDLKINLYNLDDPFSGKASTYTFRKAYRNQFLDERGHFRSYQNESPSLHTALPIQDENNKEIIAWIKACPENATLEHLALKLAWGIGKGGIPPSLIGKLQRKDERLPLAVLLSAHAEGISLVKETAERINQISSPSFTQALLRLSIAVPWDDKPEDYRIHDDNLSRIDNECIFAPPTQTNFFGKASVSLRSVLPFHDHMQQSLDQKTVEKFVAINPLELGTRLLLSLEKLHFFLTSSPMFEREDIERHFQPKKLQDSWKIKVSNISLLSVVLTKQWVITFLHNIASVHQCCQETGITGMDLFKTVHPEVWELIQKAWKANLPGRLPACLERLDLCDLFKKDANGFRSSRFASFDLISESQGYSLSLEMYQQTWGRREIILKKEKSNQAFILPATMLEEYTQKSLKEVVEKFNTEDPSFVPAFTSLFAPQQTVFLESVHKQIINPKQQELILKALSRVRSIFHHPDLSYLGQAINEKLLGNILSAQGKRMLSLKLRAGPGIKQITSIDAYCQSLTKLDLDHCTGLQQVSLEHVQSLTHLYLRNSSVQKVRVRAPILQTLDVSNSEQIKEVETTSEHLKHVGMNGCKDYNVAQFPTILKNPFTLEKFDCEGISLLPWQRQALDRYPFLVHWLPHLSKHVVGNIMAALQKLEQIHDWKALKKPQQEKLTKFLNALSASSQKVTDLINTQEFAEFGPILVRFVPPALEERLLNMLMVRLRNLDMEISHATNDDILSGKEGKTLSESEKKRDHTMQTIGAFASVLANPFPFFRHYQQPGGIADSRSNGLDAFLDIAERTDKDFLIGKQWVEWLAAGHLGAEYIPVRKNLDVLEQHCLEILKRRRTIRSDLPLELRTHALSNNILSSPTSLILLLRLAFNQSSFIDSDAFAAALISCYEAYQSKDSLISKLKESITTNEYNNLLIGLNANKSILRVTAVKFLKILNPIFPEKQKETQDALLKTFVKESSSEVQIALIEALEQFTYNEEVFTVLLETFYNSKVGEGDASLTRLLPVRIIQALGKKEWKNCPRIDAKSGQMEALLKALTSSDVALRRAAAESLAVVGSAGKQECRALLLAVYRDNDFSVKKAALKALENPSMIDSLLVALISEDETVRWAAINALYQFEFSHSSSRALLSEFIRVLAVGPESHDRYSISLWILSRIFLRNEGLIDCFVDILGTCPFDKRHAGLAADLLESIDLDSEQVKTRIPKIVSLAIQYATNVPDNHLPDLLGKHAHSNEEALKKLQEKASDPDHFQSALHVLWRMQTTFPAANKWIEEASETRDSDRRKEAQKLLKKPPVKGTPQSGEQTTEERRRWIAHHAKANSNGNDISSETLLTAIGSSRAPLWLDRLTCIEGLACLGIDRPQVILALSNALNEESGWVKLAAAKALIKLWPQKDTSPPQDALKTLLNFLIQGDDSIKEAALHILRYASERALLGQEDYEKLMPALSDHNKIIALQVARLFINSPYLALFLKGLPHTNEEFTQDALNLVLDPSFHASDNLLEAENWPIHLDFPLNLREKWRIFSIRLVEKVIIYKMRKNLYVNDQADKLNFDELLKRLKESLEDSKESIRMAALESINAILQEPNADEIANIELGATNSFWSLDFAIMKALNSDTDLIRLRAFSIYFDRFILQGFHLDSFEKVFQTFMKNKTLLREILKKLEQLGPELSLTQKINFQEIFHKTILKICLKVIMGQMDETIKNQCIKSLRPWMTKGNSDGVIQEIIKYKLKTVTNPQAIQLLVDLGKSVKMNTLLATKPEFMLCLLSGKRSIENILQQIWE